MSQSRATHLHFVTGKRVYVKLATGELFVDKFVETKSKAVILEERGKILNKNICSMTIYKGDTKNDKGTRENQTD